MSALGSVLIFGAGSIGCFIGAALAETGAAVTLVTRQRMIDEIGAHGITLTELDGAPRHIAASNLTLLTDVAQAPSAQLTLVTVKSRDTAAASSALASRQDRNGLVISFQNGIDNATTLAASLGQDGVIAGMVPFNIVHQGQGRFHRATEGTLAIAAHPSLPAHWQAGFDRARLPLAIHSHFERVQWAKLLLNLNNSINALAGLPLQQELRDRHYRRALAAVMSEALDILAVAGIPPARLTPIPMRYVPTLLRLPTWLFERVARAMLAIDPSARSSMWDDLDRGRPTEARAINGAVVALAERLGRSAPRNARIIELIETAEHNRRGSPELTGPALWRLVQDAAA